jgi:hypothetical protein
MIKQIRRTYTVDPNRIYLYGYSMGGYGVSCVGCSEADVFAALGINAAGTDYTGAGENLMHTPLTIHIGEDDVQTNRIGKARNLKNLVKRCQDEHPGSYTIHYKEYPGTGHSLPMSARKETFDWMGKFARNPLPKKIVWKGFWNAARKVPEKRYFFWLAATDLKKETRIQATIRDGNVIVVEARSASSFTIFLNDALVDLTKPVKVVVNGAVRYSGKVPASLSAVVESLVAKEDPNMVFTARIDIAP